MKARINTLVANVVAWAKEYKQDCEDSHKPGANKIYYLKKYWYVFVALLTIPVALSALVYKLTKKDELEEKLEEERRIDKRHYRVR